MSISSPKGTYDILPSETDPSFLWREIHLWHYVESMIFKITKSFGFQEIRTPLFERTELFQRGVGESTDVVSKEMYTFEDKGGRSMSLRPEMTASVMRTFIEKNLHVQSPIHKLFYMGPMFRYDRPQAGRYRQFFQFGVEAIGNSSAEQDVEVIDMLYTLSKSLGLKDLTLHINSVGDVASRERFSNALREFLTPNASKLSKDSRTRLVTNPLRILDSKENCDHEQLVGSPTLDHYLSDESKSHFSEVLNLLEKLKIPYFVNPKLVRGLDYYNKTVFELTSGDLGAQNTIGGGGRYDGLMKTLGGPDLPSVGFALGIERLIQSCLAQNVSLPSKPAPSLFIIALGEAANEYCFKLVHELRMQDISSEMDYTSKKLKDKLRTADSRGAKYVLVVGEDELKNDRAELKDMHHRSSKQITLSTLLQELKLNV